MMRLIDIEAPCKIEIVLDGEKCHATVTAPTVDAVPVVRCEDCKHGEKEDGMYYCHYTGETWNDGNFYCAGGERKDNADNR